MRDLFLALALLGTGCAATPEPYQPWADPVAEINFYKNLNAVYPVPTLPAPPQPYIMHDVDTGRMGLVLITPALPQ